MLNLNIGILGHVDAGKTSLAKCLSEIASTAAFDKSPQSKERGITLDLGFSSFKYAIPEHLKHTIDGEFIQYTLVDCPGHASLIKTIICGAQIIDMMLLIIDVNKGIQTQTAECLIIGEITCKKMIIVLNKIDLLEDSIRTQTIEKMKLKLKKTLSGTNFNNENVPIISVSANPDNLMGIYELIKLISEFTFMPIRNKEGPLIYAIDHCFAIKGQGTILTGTILQGNIQINDVRKHNQTYATHFTFMYCFIFFRNLCNDGRNVRYMAQCLNIPLIHVQDALTRFGETQLHTPLIERQLHSKSDNIYIPTLNISKKVKSMQMFRKPVTLATQGDRLGICVTQFDPKLLERGIVCSPGVGNFITHAIIKVNCIKYFKQEIQTKTKFHVTIGYETNLAEIHLFSLHKDAYLDGIFNFDLEYNFEATQNKANLIYYMLLHFEKPVFAIDNSILIGAKLDIDIHKNTCRLAFWGHLLVSSSDEAFLNKLKVFKIKSKTGYVERIVNDNTVIVKNLFKKETDLQKFVNLKVTLSTGDIGKIESSFGQSGKVKVYIQDGLKSNVGKIDVLLEFKRFLYDVDKKIYQ